MEVKPLLKFFSLVDVDFLSSSLLTFYFLLIPLQAQSELVPVPSNTLAGIHTVIFRDKTVKTRSCSLDKTARSVGVIATLNYWGAKI